MPTATLSSLAKFETFSGSVLTFSGLVATFAGSTSTFFEPTTTSSDFDFFLLHGAFSELVAGDLVWFQGYFTLFTATFSEFVSFLSGVAALLPTLGQLFQH